MQLVVFTRALQRCAPESLVDLARALGVDGYDLCVRPGYPVTPDNAAEELPRVADLFRRYGVALPMVTAPTDLVAADDPRAQALLAAMDRADVRLLKIGYFRHDPAAPADADVMDGAQRQLAAWEQPARRHGVRVCYHTHSGPGFIGNTAAGLAALLQGIDPAWVGAYLDPGHLLAEGEPFAAATGPFRDSLCALALKDVHLIRTSPAGPPQTRWVEAGQGSVDWKAVGGTLRAVGFQGPLSMHLEFEVPDAQFAAALAREAAFFQHLRQAQD